MTDDIHLLIIDPQRDFCDPNGSLYVPGADGDMDRVAALVRRLRRRLSAIHITLDSHRKVDISHPIWFRDGDGAHPEPFTVIAAADLQDGRWTTTLPTAYDRTLAYLRALEASQRYPHVIWPYHCLIGDEGHQIWPSLAEAVHEWEERFATADFVTKGSNPWTEHFSAVQAEVPDPTDPTTQVNTRLIATLEQADVIALAGEALSHCLANTVRDIASTFADPAYVSKLVLLTDGSSSVPTFESYGDEFLRELRKLGMRTSTTTDFLAS
ncbi:MAG: isochorismatase family protein [Deltaproteobacteria bacterium]|jgi:nicotinamidase-related amidase|nr:isochorismatase family protein [Deltaproteobacteria bacterium]MBW2531290.1 isochorismatase family protein [Deltaproteobacteria bacterium]